MLKKVFSLQNESSEVLETLLDSALSFKQQVLRQGWNSVALNQPYLVFQVFFEPSTRTRVSFETATQRLGLRHSYFQMDDFTSMSKGETYWDSLGVFAQNSPDLMIIRSGTQKDVQAFIESTDIPIICAGFGEFYHPTQALLDLMTVMEDKGLRASDLKGLKILFVGDVKNSRVAHSHFILSQKLGYHLGQCAEEVHWASESNWQKFDRLPEAMAWADVVIRLRTQKERGSAEVSKDYMITADLLKQYPLALMHPGPFMRGEDFEQDLPEHPLSLIWKQKANGHYMRAYLIRTMLLGKSLDPSQGAKA